MRNLQRGQAIVEFAVVLPLFLLLVFAILFVGMVMADYLTLNSIARSSAREAAMINQEEYKQYKYTKIRSKYEKEQLPIDIFKWEPEKSKENFKITYESNSQNVKVEMMAELNTDGYALAKVVDNLAGSKVKKYKLNITYNMHSEKKL